MKQPTLALLSLALATPLLADSRFSIRQMQRNDVPQGKGQCDIRLQVDDEAEVTVRGTEVYIHTLSGRDARDDGSECNAPFPPRGVQGFNFEVRDSRGDIQLVSDPSRGNGAVVRIRDSKGGEGRYHFRLSWALYGNGGNYDRGNDGGYNRGNNDRGYNDRGSNGGFDPRNNDRGYNDRGNNGGFDPRNNDRGYNGGGGYNGQGGWRDRVDFQGRGTGGYQRNSEGERRIYDVNVTISQDGRVVTRFSAEGGEPLAFIGNIVNSDGRNITADVVAGDRARGLRGRMEITLDDRRQVVRVNMQGDAGRGDRFRLYWRR